MANGTEIIKKDNALIEARYRMTQHEQRVIVAMLAMIRADDEDFQFYRINVGELLETFGMERNKKAYTQIEEACKTLLGRRIEIIEDKRYKYANWLSSIEYEKGKGSIYVRFDPMMKPYLLQLQSRFTEYNLAAVAPFRSAYSIRFYELLKMHQYKGNGGQFYRTLTVDEIRQTLCIEPHEYSMYFDLRKRAITPALAEIDEHSDIRIVSVEERKEGRAIKYITITAEPKKLISAPESESHDPGPDAATEKSDTVVMLEEAGIDETTARAWERKFGVKKIAGNFNYVLAKQEAGVVDSFAAYLAKALAGDYAGKAAEERMGKAKKAREEKARAEIEERKAREADAANITRSRKMTKEAAAAFCGLPEAERARILDAMEEKATSTMARKAIEKARKDPSAVGAPILAKSLKDTLDFGMSFK